MFGGCGETTGGTGPVVDTGGGGRGRVGHGGTPSFPGGAGLGPWSDARLPGGGGAGRSGSVGASGQWTERQALAPAAGPACADGLWRVLGESLPLRDAAGSEDRTGADRSAAGA